MNQRINHAIKIINTNIDRDLFLPIYIDRSLRWINIKCEYELEKSWGTIWYNGSYVNRKYPIMIWNELKKILEPEGYTFTRGFEK